MMVWRKLGACLFHNKRGGDPCLGDDTAPFRSVLSFDDVVGDDTLLEIFSRLPAKSVVECKRVCRRWYALINNPYFVETHLKRCKGEATVMFFNGWEINRPALFIDHTTKNSRNKVWRVSGQLGLTYYGGLLVGSCDGMLLLQNEFVYSQFFVLHNPMNGEVVAVKPPTKDDSCCGFFFDGLINEYKIILFCYKVIGDEHSIVYSTYGLRTKLCIEICKFEFYPQLSSCASVNLHNKLVCWCVAPLVGSGVLPHRCSECIMIYKVDTTKISIIPHPEDACFGCDNGLEAFCSMQLLELENCIAFVGSTSSFIYIWVLEDLKIKFSWVKRHVVDLRVGLLKKILYVQVLNIDDDELLLHWPGEGLLWYNPLSNGVHKIKLRLDRHFDNHTCITSVNLKPSLVSPDHITSSQLKEYLHM